MSTPNDGDWLLREPEGSGGQPEDVAVADAPRGHRPGVRAIRTDVEARNRVVQANLGLVYRVARQYQNRGLSLEDLVGEGNLGLIRAAQVYDPKRGTRFSTCAYFWIREAIQSALANTGATIRVPMNIARLMARWERTRRALKQERGCSPSFNEVAETLDLDPATRDAVARAIRVSRIQAQVFRLGESPWRSIAMADPGSSPAELFEERDEREAILNRLNQLGRNDRTILVLKFGLSGEPPMSFEQIGARLGLSTIRVQRAAALAIRKLGHPQHYRAETPGTNYHSRVG